MITQATHVARLARLGARRPLGVSEVMAQVETTWRDVYEALAKC